MLPGFYRQDENHFYLSSSLICLLITLYVLCLGVTVNRAGKSLIYCFVLCSLLTQNVFLASGVFKHMFTGVQLQEYFRGSKLEQFVRCCLSISIAHQRPPDDTKATHSYCSTFLDSHNSEMKLVFLPRFRSLKFVAVVCSISVQSPLCVIREHIM